MMDRLWAPWRLEYIQGPGDNCCIFCLDESSAEDQARLVVVRGEDSYVIMNRYPYSNGHLMVSPYRHVSDPASLESAEVLEIHQLMIRCQLVLREVCAAQGFNVGWNIGPAAGAGIADHIHMHIVPRWAGDVNFMPILADTRVIPQHIEKTYALLAKAFLEI
jgi:ATP adenylyltransferase